MDVKGQIVGMVNSGKNARQIGCELGIANTTVSYVLRRFRMTGSNENTPRTGRPSILTNCDKTHLATIIKRNHFIPLCEVTNQLPTKVSRWTVNEALKEHGIGLHIAAKKPNVTLGNINKCWN